MNDVGARQELVSAVPSLQELARRTYCMELTLAVEYSCLCHRFIWQCVHWAVEAENGFRLNSINNLTPKMRRLTLIKRRLLKIMLLLKLISISKIMMLQINKKFKIAKK